jgi:preprotein translocase subunit SecF
MSVLRRLYRGDTNVDFIGLRKRWYIASAIIVVICIGAFVFRGFNFGIEFAGGNQFLMPVKPGTSVEEVRHAVDATGVDAAPPSVRGNGPDRRYVIRTPGLSNEQRTDVVNVLAAAGKVAVADVERKEVSSSWGHAVTEKALIALVVFLILVGGYIWVRFEQKMALAALAALVHDLLLSAGVYSLVGFEVTPGTVIGLLTILGFSLYDTVVVFDKVEENTRGLLGSTRHTYPEAANLAVNQTLMRSINTSLIALLPVAGLLFVGAGLLGVGTLKDLALVLFVGMATGAYSSLFLATPWLVDLKLLDQRYRLHAQRVLAKRAAVEGKGDDERDGAGAGPVKAGAAKTRAVKAGTAGTVNAKASVEDGETEPDETEEPPAMATSSPRRPGAKAAQRRRPGGGGRPSGKRR